MVSIVSQVGMPLAMSFGHGWTSGVDQGVNEETNNQPLDSKRVFTARLLKTGLLATQIGIAGLFISPIAGVAAASVVALGVFALLSTTFYMCGTPQGDGLLCRGIRLLNREFSNIMDVAALCMSVGIAVLGAPVVGIFSASYIGISLVMRMRIRLINSIISRVTFLCYRVVYSSVFWATRIVNNVIGAALGLIVAVISRRADMILSCRRYGDNAGVIFGTLFGAGVVGASSLIHPIAPEGMGRLFAGACRGFSNFLYAAGRFIALYLSNIPRYPDDHRADANEYLRNYVQQGGVGGVNLLDLLRGLSAVNRPARSEEDISAEQFSQAESRQQELAEKCEEYVRTLETRKGQVLAKVDADQPVRISYSNGHLNDNPFLKTLINIIVPQGFRIEEMLQVSDSFDLTDDQKAKVRSFYNRIYGDGINFVPPSDYAPLQREIRELAYLMCKENERIKKFEEDVRYNLLLQELSAEAKLPLQQAIDRMSPENEAEFERAREIALQTLRPEDRERFEQKQAEVQGFIDRGKTNIYATFMSMVDLFNDQACGGRDADIAFEHKYSLIGASEYTYSKTMAGRIHIVLLKKRKEIIQELARTMTDLGCDNAHRANAIIKNMGEEFGITTEAATADMMARSFTEEQKQRVREAFGRLYNQETITRTLQDVLRDSHDPTLTKDHVLDWFAEGLGEEAKAERWGKLYTEDYTDFDYEIVLPCLLAASGFSDFV